MHHTLFELECRTRTRSVVTTEATTRTEYQHEGIIYTAACVLPNHDTSFATASSKASRGDHSVFSRMHNHQLNPLYSTEKTRVRHTRPQQRCWRWTGSEWAQMSPTCYAFSRRRKHSLVTHVYSRGVYLWRWTGSKVVQAGFNEPHLFCFFPPSKTLVGHTHLQ